MFCPNCGAYAGNARFRVRCDSAVEAPSGGRAGGESPPRRRREETYAPPQPVCHCVQQPAPPIVVHVHNSNTNTAIAGRLPRRRSILFGLFMICITGGLWIIRMIVRPKYY